MKCSRCNINDATILIKQNINGKESDYSLCESCAKEIGLSMQHALGLNGFAGTINPGYIFNALNQVGNSPQVNTGVFVPGKAGSGVCEFCKMTISEFRDKGKLGCAHCYEAFSDQLSQVFRRIQSGESHRGRKLAETKERIEERALQDKMQILREAITKAVAVENYEEAARFKSELEQVKIDAENLNKSNDSKKKPVGEVISKVLHRGADKKNKTDVNDSSSGKEA